MKTKKHTTNWKLLLLFLVSVGIFTNGCKKEKNNLPALQESAKTNVVKPRNPYTVKNMRKTLAKMLVGDVQLIRNNKPSFAKGKIMFSDNNATVGINRQMTAEDGLKIAENGISATHYYIKFMPRDDADYSKLKADSNLVIYPFPLDNEQSEYSGNYRDPSVPAGVPTFQYTAVPVGYKLTDVPYQKLEDLYLPDVENAKAMVTVTGENNSSYAVPAQQLARLAECGIDDDPTVFHPAPEDCGGGGGGSYPPNDPYRNGDNWRPHGRMTVYDEVLGAIVGVEGLRIRARRWFTTYNGFTDANGYYAVDGWFTNPANYWMDFERYEFSVNDHGGGPREISGPKIESAWNIQFEDYDKFCSTIFRAAYHYYYKDIQGLRRPPGNGFLNTQMKLGAYNGTDPDANLGDHVAGRRFFGLGEAIHIFDSNRPIDDVYATTIHELGHAVHWDLAASDYRNSDLIVSESWAVGVQWVLTRMVYPNYYGRPNGTQNYTNVIMDMIDGPGVVYYQYVAGGYYQHGTGSPIDEVGYYDIVQIQNTLYGAITFNDWKNNIYNQIPNSTKNNLDVLFGYWDTH